MKDLLERIFEETGDESPADFEPGWLVQERRAAELDPLSAAARLAMQAAWPGALRCVSREGVAWVRDEVPRPTTAGDGKAVDAADLLGRWRRQRRPSRREIEAALDGAGVSYASAGDGWDVALSTGSATATARIARSPCGAKASLLIVPWEEDASLPPALAAYLQRAQRQLRFVRFELQPRAVQAVAQATTRQLENELPLALAALAQARRATAAPARALLSPELGLQYLAFHQ